MNFSGRYRWDSEQMKLIKISDEIPNVSPLPAWMPKGDVPYFDKSARRRFESKAQKRKWLKENKMKEGGIYNPKEVGL